MLLTDVRFTITNRRSRDLGFRTLDIQGFKRGYVGKSDPM